MCNFQNFCEQYIIPFSDPHYIYNKTGWIVWRTGTGSNAELLHIRTHEKRKGYGRVLFYGMLRRLRYTPPYYSVFGFTRSNNEEANAFYGALGFNLTALQGLYKDGQAVLFWQEYKALCEHANITLT